MGLAFIVAYKRGWLFGRLFSVYLMAYGVFRFFTEYLRETPKFFDGLSGYQVLSIPMIFLGGAFFLKRTIAPPVGWSAFRNDITGAVAASATKGNHG
jgi:prolipoprotein diacylglyceryltransferase